MRRVVARRRADLVPVAESDGFAGALVDSRSYGHRHSARSVEGAISRKKLPSSVSFLATLDLASLDLLQG